MHVANRCYILLTLEGSRGQFSQFRRENRWRFLKKEKKSVF